MTANEPYIAGHLPYKSTILKYSIAQDVRTPLLMHFREDQWLRSETPSGAEPLSVSLPLQEKKTLTDL